MKILHELLATEKNFSAQVNKLMLETLAKFDKEHLFKGFVKTLKLFKDAPGNEQIEAAASERKELVTTVTETLGYLLGFWVESENIQAMKNRTNQKAVADVVVGKFEGGFVLSQLPVDELLGLESRLQELRKVFDKMPTLDASKTWVRSAIGKDVWESAVVEVTTKTEKVITPVVLYEATKEHPAQIKEMSKDEVVGTFSTKLFSGAVTSLQKAQVLERLDQLLVAVKQARMRANSVELVPCSAGTAIFEFLLKPLRD